jgi:hypothetical protein
MLVETSACMVQSFFEKRPRPWGHDRGHLASGGYGIFGLATRHRLPAVYGFSYYAKSGGLVSYGINVRDMYLRSASYVDRILKGAKPGTYRFRRRQNSSWSSTSRPPRPSASTCRQRCSRAPTR